MSIKGQEYGVFKNMDIECEYSKAGEWIVSMEFKYSRTGLWNLSIQGQEYEM